MYAWQLIPGGGQFSRHGNHRLSSSTFGEDKLGCREHPRISTTGPFFLAERKAYDLNIAPAPLTTGQGAETSGCSREVPAQGDCTKRHTGLQISTYQLLANGPQRIQPAFATWALCAWPADTTSAGRHSARSSASAKATGNAEVRRFTSNCKSRAL
jgi:hypothetical protein